MPARPLILITNDDGYDSKGITTLARAMQQLGEVVVVAPLHPHSGMSQAVTTRTPLRLYDKTGEHPYRVYAVEGTPTDCVKLGLDRVVDRRPSVLLSGVNHGSNASINALYSGTVGAAMEGCLYCIPSVALSLAKGDSHSDYQKYMEHCLRIVRTVLHRGLPQGTMLNVNLPRHPLQGIKVCRQADAYYGNEFDEREDPRGQMYYWLADGFNLREPGALETDETALQQGFISVVPLRVDLTDHEFYRELKGWEWQE